MKLWSVNTLMYILLLVMLFVVHRVEQNDWECSNAYEWWEKCVPDEGMPYRGSTPNKSDSADTLLNKINIAAGVEDKSIKWRRSFIMAVICSFLIFVLVITPGTLPVWYTFYLTVFLLSGSWYFHFANYSYHKFKPAEQNIYDSTSLLREKCS